MAVDAPDFPEYDVVDSAQLDEQDQIVATSARQRDLLNEPSILVDASDFGTPELAGLIAKLQRLCAQEHGYGLSAVQIGFPARVFVLGANAGAGVFVNPAIETHGRDIVEQDEACLSFPGYVKLIARWRVITATWQDANGRTHRERISGIRARAFQHELDHLDGVTILDDAAGVAEGR